MWPYWLLFMLPAFAALSARRRERSLATGFHSLRLNAVWIGLVVLLTLTIGYRVEVGGDWFSYLRFFDYFRFVGLDEAVQRSDPGYQILNWLSLRFGFGIWGVNLFCGVVSATGLALFCRSLPRPWLAMTVAVPYVLTVVFMGYSRQGVALGFAMLGLISLSRGSIFVFVIWTLIAATFHKSALLLMPIAALAATQRRIWTICWLAVVTFGAYLLLLEDAVDRFVVHYIAAQYQSEGALVRSAMNFVPAVILLLTRKRFSLAASELSLWVWFARFSVVLMLIVLLTPATTAVDRIGLYLLPLQLVVFAHLPDSLGLRARGKELVVFCIVAYYALVHFVWLTFATHARYWIPYRNFLFE